MRRFRGNASCLAAAYAFAGADRAVAANEFSATAMGNAAFRLAAWMITGFRDERSDGKNGDKQETKHGAPFDFNRTPPTVKPDHTVGRESVKGGGAGPHPKFFEIASAQPYREDVEKRLTAKLFRILSFYN